MDPRSDLDDERPLRLDQFLKIQQVAQTGGQAKLLIQGGEILVNGQVETRRRRQLKAGDEVEYDGQLWRLEATED